MLAAFLRLQMDPTAVFSSGLLWSGVLIFGISHYTMNLYEVYPWLGRINSPIRIATSLFILSLSLTTLIFSFRFQSEGLSGRGVVILSMFFLFFFNLGIRSLLQILVQGSFVSGVLTVVAPSEFFDRIKQDLNYLLGFPRLEMLSHMPEGIESLERKELIAISEKLDEQHHQVALKAKLNGQRLIPLIQLYERFLYRIPVHFVDAKWFLVSSGFDSRIISGQMKLKRLIDLGLASLIGILSSPLIAVAVVMIRLESPGPVFFRQRRVGKNGSIFELIKLRSMREDAEINGAQWAKVSDSRITRVGRFLRLTRIDEIPQVINIIKGDMSLIGPRPERPEFTSQLETQIPFYSMRHLVTPGLTGWAQINYPYGASTEDAVQKLQFDLYYIKNHSLSLDFRIFLRTAQVVLFAKGR